MDKVRDDPAQGGKHGNAAVLDLGLLQVRKGQPAGEPNRVKADITHHRAVQGSGAGQEGEGLGLLGHHADGAAGTGRRGHGGDKGSGGAEEAGEGQELHGWWWWMERGLCRCACGKGL